MPATFSYRLQVRVEPEWAAIIKRVVGLANEQEQQAFDAIIEFSVALQLRFPDVSTEQVVKWPEKIDNTLRKIGVAYKAPFDYTPRLTNIEKEDPSFFSKHGGPQVATTKSFPSPYFEGECAYYSIDLEVFTPERARSMSRLAYTELLGSS